MNAPLVQNLRQVRGKQKVQEVVDLCIAQPSCCALLIKCLYEEDPQLQKASAWVVGHLGEQCPQMLAPYLQKLLERLTTTKSAAVKRNIFRLLQFQEWPPEVHASLFNTAIAALENSKEAVAVRVFAMSVAVNICKAEPRLADELILLIEANMTGASAGFVSRGKKSLKVLNRLKA